MKQFKKAYIVIPHWSDTQNPIVWKLQHGCNAIYAESASKAKYKQYLNIEDQENEFYKYRALRWKEKDLFPPVLHPQIKDLTKSELNKMIHTCAADHDTDPGYRNYYNGSIDDKDLNHLCEIQLMGRNTNNDHILNKGSTYFYLTEIGLRVANSTRPILRENL